MQNHHDCTSAIRDVWVLGTGAFVPKHPSLMGESVGSAIQQQTSQQSSLLESLCLASGVSHEYSGRFSEEVASTRIYESRWFIFGKWCEESQVDISDPTIPDIANFLNCLFTEKNPKPSTFADYRTVIADGLGLKGEEVSKSLELNRFLASFYRDKPGADRSIPPWDLALVLHAFLRQPFEPLGKAS